MSKTWKRPVTIYHTVTAAEASAGEAVIGVYSGQLPTDSTVFNFQVQRSGVPQADAKLVYSTVSGALGLSDNGTYSVTEDDVLVAQVVYV